MTDYEALYACFASGQMNAAQLQGHMADDPEFAAWVRGRITGTHIEMSKQEQDTDLAWRIMEAAGGTRIRVEEYAPGYYLVASREHGAGVTSPKEDAFDTVQEVALHLVSQQAVARAREQEKASQVEAAHVETVSTDALPPAAGSGGDSDAGQWQVGDGPAADFVPAGDAGPGAASDAVANGGSVGDEPGESGLVRSAVEGEDFAPEAEEPTDAEFSDAEFEHDSHAVELDDDDIPEMILIENDPNDIPVEEPVYAGPIEHGSPGGVVYFGDDIQVIKLAKMGRLAQIARALKDVLQEGWTLEEFSSLQNLIVRVDRGEMPYDHRAQMRWDEIGARSRTMGRIDKYKDDRELELDTLDRAGIEAFDPEEGWPE